MGRRSNLLIPEKRLFVNQLCCQRQLFLLARRHRRKGQL